MTVFEPPWVLMPNDFACHPSPNFYGLRLQSLSVLGRGSVLSLSILAPSAMFRWEALCEHSPGTATVASPYLDSTTLSSLISFTKFIIVEHDRLICLFLAASPSLIVDCISSLSSLGHSRCSTHAAEWMNTHGLFVYFLLGYSFFPVCTFLLSRLKPLKPLV